MPFRNLGLASVLLAAIAVGGVIFSLKRGPPPEVPLTSEVVDRMVVDYAYSLMRTQSKQAVASCGADLVGQQADVTASVSVREKTVHLSNVRVSQPGWTSERLGCVRGVLEGHARSPSADGVRISFPENAEYEVDATLFFEAPTLQYSE